MATKRRQIDLTEVNFQELKKAVKRHNDNGAKDTVSALANRIISDAMKPPVVSNP